MAINTYVATAEGYVDGRVVKVGETFTTEFKGFKRAAPVNGEPGEIERDKNGNPVMIAIPDPKWVRRVSAAESVAIDAAVNPTPDDVNLEAMSASELRSYAATIGVDATGLSKADALTAIKAARPPAI